MRFERGLPPTPRSTVRRATCMMQIAKSSLTGDCGLALRLTGGTSVDARSSGSGVRSRRASLAPVTTTVAVFVGRRTRLMCITPFNALSLSKFTKKKKRARPRVLILFCVHHCHYYSPHATPCVVAPRPRVYNACQFATYVRMQPGTIRYLRNTCRIVRLHANITSDSHETATWYLCDGANS